ncbi:MAG: ABC transporter permease [Prevotellaceae bacterium]|jgi:ABC-2 type transport system permease protein|nr:ABC transporter permease [Prevotellaceae bacterium]
MSENHKTGIIAVVKREVERMVSRPIYLVMTLIIPLVTYIFFITLLNNGLPDKMPIAIVDMDNSSISRLLVRQLDATQQSRVVSKLPNFNEANRQMQEGSIYAFVVIPENFQADIVAGRQPEVPFYTQNAYYIAGSLLMKDMAFTIAMIVGGTNLQMRLAKGQSEDYAMSQIQPITVDVNSMGNAWINYSVYLSTTMLPGMLQIMILIVTVFSVGTELKYRTSREWLITGNKSILKSVIGKLFPYTIIFTLLVLLSNVLLFRYLQFPFLGSTWQMVSGSLLFVLAQQGLGLFLIGLLPVLRDGLTMTAIFGTLAVSFSGLTFPIEGMLSSIQAWSVVFPLRHYFLIYVSQALTGAEIVTSWPSYLALLAFALLPITILLRLKKAAVRLNFKPD